MCGIVSYTGPQSAAPIILAGLEKLECGEYDSAGICTVENSKLHIRRSKGKLENLDRLLKAVPVYGQIGIGHTRRATHGKPTEKNAHPHRAGSVAVVHNGIIENYLTLRESLQRLGHIFKSETDTEVIAHLVEQKMKDGAGFEEAVRSSLRELEGIFAVCVVCSEDPGTLISAKNGSPLVVGLGNGEFLVASDVSAITGFSREMVFLEDSELAVFSHAHVSFTTIDGQALTKLPSPASI